MTDILHLINEMSPYLLLGFLIAGLMHAFIPTQYYSRYLSKQNIRSVINAALLGIPLPLCSCGVIPTAMSLHREGASKGATVSFLIATPQTGVDSIIATYSLMGLPFAVIRPFVALFTAVFGGLLVNHTSKGEGNIQREEDKTSKEEHCCCQHEEKQEEHHCCCHHEEKEEKGNCCNHVDVTPQMTFGQKIKVALQYAFVDMMEDIGKWLVIGLVVAALITVLVPNSFFAVFAGNTWLSILLVLLISIPMYICATGSIPIAVALMMKGLTPGAALVLLMAGPAANMASILVIRQRLGSQTLISYLTAIISGAIIAAIGIDYLLPRHWFTDSLVQMQECSGTGTWFQWACTGLLVSLLLHALIITHIGKPSHQHCCCEK